ncbi:cytidylate kinase family protein [Treponema sp.]
MAVLTISRDIGSGGLELARRVAELADYRMADKHVIEHIMREYGFVNFDKSYETSSGFWSAEEELTERTLSFLDRVVRAIAKTDRVVIVGRGSFVPLAGFSDTLHLRATAPFAFRVDTIMREQGIDNRAEAEKYVTKRDKIRRGFVARYYGTHWEDSSPFDMAVNVDAFGVENLAELLAATLEKLDTRKLASPSIKEIQVDGLLFEAAQKHIQKSIDAED